MRRFLLFLLCGLLLPGPLSAATGNHLVGQKSPYLQQHAQNPVDWYPWGEEAFERARRENKLIFLSIGYSTCHWCHVMAHESFEDQQVAALLNADFVAIKVDREERPDIDQVYMQVTVALTGSGGWPLTVILTPEKVPVYAGTYFPKESRYGRPGLLDLLPQIAARWRQHPEHIRDSGRQLLERLNRPRGTAVTDLGEELFERADTSFKSSFDARYGGFGQAPKFPRPHGLTYLLRRYRQTGDERLLSIVTTTLDAMRRGGIYDQLGGGFHRYSTDREWLVPHFEKMLYDQAGLALAYLEAWQVTGRQRYADTVREILDYLLRDMRDPEGGFYAAEDADSEGVEGKFYLWRLAEVKKVLGAEDAVFFAAAYGIAPEGNFAADIRGEQPGMNILHLARSLPSLAVEHKMTEAQLRARLAADRAELLAARDRRVRPQRDDKVLSAWNGLVISAFARAGRVLDAPVYLRTAQRTADFIQRMRDRQGRLLRRWREGDAAIPAFAEDYAFLARGLLDLYRADFDPRRLRQATALAQQLLDRFRAAGGGFYDTADDAEQLVSRPQSLFDGALPSANSVALEVLARLYLLTGDDHWERAARKLLARFSAEVSDSPTRYAQLLQGAMLLLQPTRQVVLVGPPEAETTGQLLDILQHRYLPETSLLLLPPGQSALLADLAPHSAGMRMLGGRPTVYICRDFSCQKPLTDPAEVAARLAKPPVAGRP
ncbi:thioredoxin domain-containing protein [Geothermobacter hydrogeniphilus]|uniref:Thioredoxin domain-containing protein n=1 Tax=Geothermobacter hydrogeniphilus TaxID=1969733 RepID=A0A2K2HEJ2_9BACT|nr:thioredoxin domain-containing protein [Geothermobacter hydrogeniphilus]PNU21679.1 thioredoxin domain-containing protein [Geothermobacter hydrogeniphilus]